MEGLGAAIAGLIGIGVTAIIFKEFVDPKTGKRTKYELYKTYNSKKDAASAVKRTLANTGWVGLMATALLTS